jgi:hypothetical protein
MSDAKNPRKGRSIEVRAESVLRSPPALVEPVDSESSSIVLSVSPSVQETEEAEELTTRVSVKLKLPGLNFVAEAARAIRRRGLRR